MFYNVLKPLFILLRNTTRKVFENISHRLALHFPTLNLYFPTQYLSLFTNITISNQSSGKQSKSLDITRSRSQFDSFLDMIMFVFTVVTLSMRTDRPEKITYSDQTPQNERLVSVYIVCHPVSIFHTSTGSEIELIKI